MSRWIGRKLGSYRILAQIRATSLDVVYRAFDEKLGRVVALQIWLPDLILPSQLPAALSAFTSMLTKLSHPNIGTLLDCDVCEGTLYMAYDFVPVRALHRRFHQPRTWQQAAQILAPVAQALAYAHHMGVVHGSLRPEQILIKEDGSPVIFDFGVELLVQQELARGIPESTWLGSDLNSHLAPERALGHRLDSSADLYSLGMIIVEWMTDHRAYVAETSREEVLLRYSDHEARMDRQLIKRMGGKARARAAGLESVPLHILTRVLHPDPAKRLANSQHFAVLLVKAALGQKIPAPLVDNPRWQPFKMQRRHWTIITMLLFLTSMCGLYALALTHPVETQVLALRAGLITVTPTPTATMPAKNPTRTPRLPTLTPTPRFTSTPTHTPTPTITPVDPLTLPYLPETPLPTVALPITRSNVQGLVTLGRWGLGQSRAIAFSPDGNQMAMGTTTGVYLFQMPDFVPAGFLNTTDAVNAVAYTPDGAAVITGEESGLVRLWEPTTGEERATLSGHKLPVRRLVISGDGRYIATTDETVIYLWDIQAGAPVGRLQGHIGTVNGLAFSQDAVTLVSVSSDFSVRLWNTADGSARASYSYTSPVLAVMFAPSGDKFYTLGSDRSLRQWTLENPKPAPFGYCGAPCNRLLVDPQGKWLAASGEQGNLMVWDENGAELWETKVQNLPANLGAITYYHDIAFQPGTGKLASMLWDNTVTLFDPTNGQSGSRLNRYGDFYTRVAISSDSKILLTETTGGQVKVWNLPDGELLLPGVPGRLLQGRVISNDSRFFAVQSSPSEVSVYSITGDKRYTFSRHVRLVGASFSLDGKMLLTGAPQQLRMWSMVSGLELQTTHRFGLGGCDTVYTLPEQGDRLIAYANRYNIMNFSGRNDDSLCNMMQPNSATLLAISPEGDTAAAAVNSTVSVWNITTHPHAQSAEAAKRMLTLTGAVRPDDYSKVLQMAFNQDESVLAAIFTDGSLRIWDATMSSSPLVQLSAHNTTPTALAISPDGRFLVTTAQDGTLRIWGIIP